MSGIAKENTKFFFCIPECRLSYLKIVQMSPPLEHLATFFFAGGISYFKLFMIAYAGHDGPMGREIVVQTVADMKSCWSLFISEFGCIAQSDIEVVLNALFLSDGRKTKLRASSPFRRFFMMATIYNKVYSSLFLCRSEQHPIGVFLDLVHQSGAQALLPCFLSLMVGNP